MLVYVYVYVTIFGKNICTSSNLYIASSLASRYILIYFITKKL